jgi:hypothetical protein
MCLLSYVKAASEERSRVGPVRAAVSSVPPDSQEPILIAAGAQCSVDLLLALMDVKTPVGVEPT